MLEFHHIGIACEDIEKQKNFIKNFFNVKYESETVFDKNQNASLALLTLEDGLNIELISGDAVKNILKKGVKYYHICYAVSDINEYINKFKKQKDVIVISDPKPAILFDNSLVAFLYTPMGVIELLEKK